MAGFVVALVLGGFEMLIFGSMGAVIGFAQWQVLREYFGEMRAVTWVSLTALGYGLSALVLSLVSLGYAMASAVSLELGKDAVLGFIQRANSTNTIEAILALAYSFWSARVGAALIGAMGGLVLGFAQWWVLRNHVRRAGLWILIVAVGGLVGQSVALFTSLYAYDGPDNNASLFLVILSLSPAGIFMFASFISGLGLMWLLRKQPSPN